MPREAMIWNNPTLKVATTEAGLSTGLAAECQVTQAVITGVPTYNTIPSTGCSGATQSPGKSGYQLSITWLQDWTKPEAESLSQFAWENDGAVVWVEIVPDAADTTVKAQGDFFCVAGGFGATFGDGSAAATDAIIWPSVNKPVITAPATA